MPFRSGFVPSQTVKPVVLISAGSTQFFLCTATIVQLNAIVNSVTHLVGHAIEWEQLTGSQVVLHNVNTLNPWYTEVDRTDKIFRIYIDKDSASEQYDDVLITYKLESSLTVSTPGNFKLNSQFGYQIGVDCNDIHVTMTPYPFPPPDILFHEQISDIGEYKVRVTWEHPGHPLKDKYINKYQVFANGGLVAVVQCDGYYLPSPEQRTCGDLFGGASTDPYEYYYPGGIEIDIAPLGFGGNPDYRPGDAAVVGFGGPINEYTRVYTEIPEFQPCAEGMGPPTQKLLYEGGEPGSYFIRTHSYFNGISTYKDSCIVVIADLEIPDKTIVYNDSYSSLTGTLDNSLLQVKRVNKIASSGLDELKLGTPPTTTKGFTRTSQLEILPAMMLDDKGVNCTVVVSETPINITRITI